MEPGISRRERLISVTANLLAIVLVITLPISIIAHNGLRAIFSSEALREGISDALLQGGELREQLVDQVYTAGWLDDVNRAGTNPFQYLTLRDRNAIADELFPDEWTRIQIEEAFASIMEWVHSDEPRPNFSLNVDSIKTHLSSVGSKRITTVLVNSWPGCTQEEELITQRALNTDSSSGIVICRPSSSLFPDLVDHLDTRFQGYLKNVQSEIAFLDGDQDSASLRGLVDIKRQFLSISLWLRWLRLSPLPLLGMVMALKIRSVRSLGRWWGVPIWIGSSLGLVIVLLIWWISPNLLSRMAAESVSSRALQSVITAILGDILRGSAFHLLILLILGVGLNGLAWAMNRRGSAFTIPITTEVVEKLEARELEGVGEVDSPSEGKLSPPPVKPFDPGELSDSENGDLD